VAAGPGGFRRGSCAAESRSAFQGPPRAGPGNGRPATGQALLPGDAYYYSDYQAPKRIETTLSMGFGPISEPQLQNSPCRGDTAQDGVARRILTAGTFSALCTAAPIAASLDRR
jgi:hypothetical protein